MRIANRPVNSTTSRGQALGKRYAAQHAGLGRVEQATAHAGAGARVATQRLLDLVGLAGAEEARAGLVDGRDRGGNGAGFGARARELDVAAGRLIAGAHEERDDDEARQQRGAALAHEGQGHAGEGHQAGDAAHDEEGLERDGRGEAARDERGKVGLGACGDGEAAHGEEQ